MSEEEKPEETWEEMVRRLMEKHKDTTDKLAEDNDA